MIFRKNCVINFSSILVSLTWVVAVLFSCTPDSGEIGMEDLNKPADGYMQLTFDLPGFETPPSRTATRAMTPERESTINKNKLHVFVFDKNNKFEYQAPVLVGTYSEDVASKTATVTVKLVKSDIECTVVVLANNDLPAGLDLEAGVTTIDGLYKQCVYSMPQDGKWKTDVSIPMWGESARIVVSEKNTPKVAISLRRAMARIDVGLNFTTEAGKLMENANGLANFKIKEIKIVRTYNQGLVGSVNSDLSVANIPEGAARRESNTPLSFAVPDGTNSFVREIYLPQSDRPVTGGKVDETKIHCVVVGGHFTGSSEITYYRMDFADKPSPGGNPAYLDIAGNYRYVFNITGVTGPGFSTYEEALLSIPTINYQLIAWDESIHEMHVQGKYHLGLDNREITLQAFKTADKPANFRVIKYQTNYPISATDGISLEWANPTEAADPSVSPYFEAAWTSQGEKGEITITALTTNETNRVLTDLLYVKLGSFTLEVKVNQEYVNYKYTLDCNSVTLSGTYRPGYSLNPANHFIRLDISAEDISINGSDYIIETEPIHGIVFKGRGTFNFTSVTPGDPLKVAAVILRGEGKLETPADARTAPFTVTIRSNSSSGSYCETTINPVMPKLSVLTIANALAYGYDIGLTTGGSHKVLTSRNNFGPYDHSVVKVEGFEFYRAGNNISELGSEAMAWLKNGKEKIDEDGVRRRYLADILCVGQDGLYSINAYGVGVIMDYMKNGGVVIMYNEGARNSESGPSRIMRGLFPSANITVNSLDANAVIPFVGNDFYKTGVAEKDWNAFMYKLQADPILNGPFGDIRNKQWGEDASWATAINTSAFPTQTVNGKTEVSSEIMIYSYLTNFKELNPSTSKNYVTGFKYETPVDATKLVSFVFFGDGGFLSSDNNSTALIPCPFWWNPSSMFPKPKPNYNGTGKDVYNSQAFCNTMAWAIERSADLFSKREAAMGR